MEKSDLQEQLAALYLRLNGFLLGFIVHAPNGETNKRGKARMNRTEVDMLAVRFPHNSEPERTVIPSSILDLSGKYIDVFICEVKGGASKPPQFNEGLRTDIAVSTVLRWIGIFEADQIERILSPVVAMLSPKNPPNFERYPEYLVPEEVMPIPKIRIRGVLFAPDRPEPAKGQTKFVHGDELVNFIWACVRPEIPRQECRTRYDFGLWGVYEPLIRYFKTVDAKPNLGQLYDALCSQ
jgi:hypothetical protein